MKLRQLLGAVLLLLGLLPPPGEAQDGPLTPFSNVRVRTDENGYLIISAGTAGAVDGPLTPGANIRVRTDENGYLKVNCASGCGGGGGGGTPAGSNGDWQINSSGSFGALTPAAGLATFVGAPSSANLAAALTDKTGFSTGAVSVFSISPALTGQPTIAQGTITTALSPLTITETRNNAAVNFPGIEYNITATAQGAASAAFRIRKGATSLLVVDAVNGTLTTDYTITAGSTVTSGYQVKLADAVVWNNNVNLYGPSADTLAQYRTTNPQAHQWFNTRTDASNGEWGAARWVSNVWRIGTNKNGTGTARVMSLDFGDGSTSAISIPVASGAMTIANGFQGPGVVYLSLNAGLRTVAVQNSGLQLINNAFVTWSSNSPGSGAADSGIDSAFARNAAGVIEVNNGTAGTYRDILTRAFRSNSVTFANAVGSPAAGTCQWFSDSSTATWGATITGGGANPVLGCYNGTNWTVAAK